MYIHGCRPQWSYKDLRHTTFSSSGHCTGSEILGQKIQALESCVRSQAGRTIRPGPLRLIRVEEGYIRWFE